MKDHSMMGGGCRGSAWMHRFAGACVIGALTAIGAGCGLSDLERDAEDIGAALRGKSDGKSDKNVLQGRLVALDASGRAQTSKGDLLVALAQKSRRCGDDADCLADAKLSEIAQYRCAVETADGTYEITSLRGIWLTSSGVLQRLHSKKTAVKVSTSGHLSVVVKHHGSAVVAVTDPASVKGDRVQQFRAGDSVVVYGNVDGSGASKKIRNSELVSGPLEVFSTAGDGILNLFF